MKKASVVIGAMALVVAATGWSTGVGLPVPSVSEVTMEQREGTRVVDITYELSGSGIVTLSIETNGVSIGDQHVTRLTGDVNKVVGEGSGSIVWYAGADWPEQEVDNAVARVTAWGVDAPPLYCAVDLEEGVGGNYPTYYYPSAEGVPNGVGDKLYKTCRMLMRRVDPTGGGGFMMGPVGGQVNVVLTAPYYIGVYQVTQQQWSLVKGNWPSAFDNEDFRNKRPVDSVAYTHIRGERGGSDQINWPETDYAVSPNSFMRALRNGVGFESFDLPTEAQWEWACRAEGESEGTYNVDGMGIEDLGRYAGNSGEGVKDGGTEGNGTAEVGSYEPNALGLYDMHGNVWEWCLNWYDNAIDGGIDPVGKKAADASHNARVRRGGSWSSSASDCTSHRRGNLAANQGPDGQGFRVVRNLGL